MVRIGIPGWHTERVHKYQVIADEIVGLIRSDAERPDGPYAPGKVVSVRGIMAAHNVSDSTARNVLKLLVRDEWVANVPDVGHFIRDGEPGAPLKARVQRLEANDAEQDRQIASHAEQIAELRRLAGLPPAD